MINPYIPTCIQSGWLQRQLLQPHVKIATNSRIEAEWKEVNRHCVVVVLGCWPHPLCHAGLAVWYGLSIKVKEVWINNADNQSFSLSQTPPPLCNPNSLTPGSQGRGGKHVCNPPFLLSHLSTHTQTGRERQAQIKSRLLRYAHIMEEPERREWRKRLGWNELKAMRCIGRIDM